MMRKSSIKITLLCLLLLAFFTITGGGYLFYVTTTGTDWLSCLMMALQNSMECLMFNPILPTQDIVDNACFMASLTKAGVILMSAYGWALVLVPFVDLLVVFSILDDFLHLFVGITFRKKRVLIVGYNEQVKRRLLDNNHDCKIYLWTEELLDAEEERELFMQKVVVKMNDSSLDDDPDKYVAKIEKLNRFLTDSSINYVVLADDSDTRNIEYYMALSSCKICEERNIHFFVRCHSYENRTILQNYFDSQLPKEKASVYHRDLRIFNFPQIQAEVLLDRMPLYKGVKDDKKVHLLIVGGGYVGEYILLHAMNQGVLSKENEILIDVIDKNPTELGKRLAERFNAGYVIHNKNLCEFSIPEEKADGKFTVRLHSCDVYDEAFLPMVKELQEAGKGDAYTYITVCVPDADANLHCAVNLAKYGWNIPIALRLSYHQGMIAYLKNINGTEDSYSDVYLMGDNEEYIGLNQIINSDEEEAIRVFNYTYNNITDVMMRGDSIKDWIMKNLQTLNIRHNQTVINAWNRNPYFKRQSSRALFFHQTMKRPEILSNAAELETELETLRQIAAVEIKKVEAELTAKGEETGKSLEEMKAQDYFWMARAWSRALVAVDEQTKALRMPNLLGIAQMEHRRFNYCYASEGWTFGKRSVEHKIHDCLCTWAELEKTPGTNDKLIYDLISVPYILEGAKPFA